MVLKGLLHSCRLHFISLATVQIVAVLPDPAGPVNKAIGAGTF